MQIHFIIHETYEGPGAFLSWANEHGYAVTYTRVYLQESLPKDIQAIDLLIVLGGPQCPATTLEECHYFSAEKEISFIRRCVEADKAVMGVCLGAQLIGEALGAKFEQSPHKEIGYFPIKLTELGRRHPSFSHFNAIETVGHWHNDMPGLTPTSRVLATSTGCPRQIIEYTPLVYGFQCHLEFTAESIAELITVSADEFETTDHHNFIQNPERLMANSSLSMNALLFEFMDKLMDSYAKSRFERMP
jgi:GMP synthase (glutamine-hydrolysing)